MRLFCTTPAEERLTVHPHRRTSLILAALPLLLVPLLASGAQAQAVGRKPATKTASRPAPAAAPKSQPPAEPKTPQKPEAADPDLAAQVTDVEHADDAASQRIQLRYQLRTGQELHSEVVHMATTDTRISHLDEHSESRTVSRKVWEVTNVDAAGNMTFVHRIAAVELSQRIGDGEEMSFDSRSTEPPAPMFNKLAETIGQPISIITIDPMGRVIEREDRHHSPNLGMGDITLAFPEEPVGVGSSWSVPREVRCRRDDGTTKLIKLREVYSVEKISAGVVTISMRAEPLTPIREPELQAQVVQQLSQGKLKFDNDAGRLISKELNWDDKVVSFAGPNSLMEYSARYNEQMLESVAAGRLPPQR
jgi:hypothetical protein